MKLIDKILEDFSILEDVNASEVDDFQNPIHIVRLKEVMASYGIQDEVINPIIRTITEQDDNEDEDVEEEIPEDSDLMQQAELLNGLSANKFS